MNLIAVHILEMGPNKLDVVLALKAALGSDLRTAKALAEQAAPRCVAKSLPEDMARKMKHALESAGATVSFSNSIVAPAAEKPVAEVVRTQSEPVAIHARIEPPVINPPEAPDDMPAGDAAEQKSFDRLFMFCFCRWANGEADGDFYDLIDPKMNLWVLLNSDSGALAAYSVLTKKVRETDDGDAEALLGTVVRGSSIPAELVSGLALSAKEEDEDGVYAYVEAHGGRLEFAESATSSPLDLGETGTACVCSMVERGEILLSTGSDGPNIAIDGAEPIPLVRIFDEIDDEETRVAVYLPDN